MLAILKDAIAPVPPDEWFVSYHLTWHIPLNKTHRVPSFTLECSNSRPPLAKCITCRQQRQNKDFFVNRYRTTSIGIALRCPDFFLSKFPDLDRLF